MKCEYAPCTDCAFECDHRITKQPWTTEEEKHLKFMREHGETFEQISIALGRSESSCESKYREIVRRGR